MDFKFNFSETWREPYYKPLKSPTICIIRKPTICMGKITGPKRLKTKKLRAKVDGSRPRKPFFSLK